MRTDECVKSGLHDADVTCAVFHVALQRVLIFTCGCFICYRYGSHFRSPGVVASWIQTDQFPFSRRRLHEIGPSLGLNGTILCTASMLFMSLTR